MEYFGVKLLLKATDNNGTLQIGEESVRLFASDTMDTAKIEAEKFCVDYINELNKLNDDERLNWSFVILDVFEMYEDPTDPHATIYSNPLMGKEIEVIENLHN